MKRLLFFLAIIVVLVLVGYVYLRQQNVDATGKIHANLYENASGAWDPKIIILPVRTQEINGQTIGSSTMLRIEWQQPKETYNHFIVTYTNLATGVATKESGEHDRVNLEPSGLTPDTDYVFALQACFDRRCEEWLIAQEEYRGRTAAEYWSVDEDPVVLNP
ncbi:MAG: fibronectin type III domain-containing protein [Patescibacteria group bacterium]